MDSPVLSFPSLFGNETLRQQTSPSPAHFHNLVLVEQQDTSHLYPFDVLHCAWELRTGPHRIIEAWKYFLKPQAIHLIGREQHVASFRARFSEYSINQIAPGMVVILSADVVPTQSLSDRIITHLNNEASIELKSNGKTIGLLLSHEQWELIPNSVDNWNKPEVVSALNVDVEEIHAPLVPSLWDSLDHISRSIDEQRPLNQEPVIESIFRQAGVYVVNQENIFIGEGTSIAPMVVLDASAGAIIIGNNATIMPHATIIGPCYIGDSSIIKAGAKIYGNTVIGEFCKIGGEVEHSIIHAYSNKQHDGFLGHSYICEWVNLGADTNTSDLKNTYGNIKVTQRGKESMTGRMFLGLLCGDHTKSGINTMFNTGTIAGIHANVFGAGYSPTEIPSFTWGAIHEQRIYAYKMAISVAKTVMMRRGKELLPEEEVLMKLELERITSS